MVTEADMTQQVYALVHEENGAFGISFPDFPGCTSTGASAEEALERGRVALAFHIEGMIEDGEPMPRLRPLAELRADPDFRDAAEGAAIALVPVDLPGKVVRVNVSIDETLLDQIDRAARAEGKSRSAFLASAARGRLAG